MSHEQTGTALVLELDLAISAQAFERSYVRVHLDHDGDGRITVGDQVSFQAHRLAAATTPEGLTIPLQLVTD